MPRQKQDLSDLFSRFIWREKKIETRTLHFVSHRSHKSEYLTYFFVTRNKQLSNHGPPIPPNVEAQNGPREEIPNEEGI
jgi:hypothetical protein